MIKDWDKSGVKRRVCMMYTSSDGSVPYVIWSLKMLYCNPTQTQVIYSVF